MFVTADIYDMSTNQYKALHICSSMKNTSFEGDKVCRTILSYQDARSTNLEISPVAN